MTQDASFKQKCRQLRRQGLTLGEIMKKTDRPKTSVYYHIKDIPLPEKTRNQISQKLSRRITKINKTRKGKSSNDRHPINFQNWTPDLVQLVAHLIFDGEITKYSCAYTNRNKVLIDRVRCLMEQVYPHKPRQRKKNGGVFCISYDNVELASLMRNKTRELVISIRNMERGHQLTFLRSFFDDEGCITIYKKTHRKVKGYQQDTEMLQLIKTLLKNFSIESRIYQKYNEIVISRKENLVKFQEKINFSKGVKINPERKNSIWDKPHEKRKILQMAINSYQDQT